MPRKPDNQPAALDSDPDVWRGEPSHPSEATQDSQPPSSDTDVADGDTDVDDPGGHARAAGYLDGSARIGRFAVLRRLGEGGMGVVYSAYDEELDRRVALKLLRPGRDNSERNQNRMQREARAMAKLSHPNVVQVYEVGRFEEQVFVAMEFVHGKTLGAWLKAGPRTWQQILDVMVQAGQGLHAAHDAGVIHGDFKPDNILIDAHDKARVVDFGLSRRADPAGASLRAQQIPGEAPSPTGPHAAITTTTTTATTTTTTTTTATASIALLEGATHSPEPPRSSARIAGTPAYMAPEQHRHHPADQRSDQFAFCITLYTALYGRHPFAGGSLLELVINLTDGRIHPPPGGHPVPAGAYAVLARGLSVDPDQRFPTMLDLLAELERGSGRARDPEFDLSVARRQRVVLGGMIGLTVLGVTAAIILGSETDDHLPTPGMNVLAGAVVNALLFGLIYGYRTALLKNTINRRVMAWLVVSSLALLAHRTIAAYNGVSVAATMVNDLILLGSVAFMAAVSIERWIAWAGAVLYFAALLTITFPAASSALLGGAIVGVFCLAVVFWSR